MPNEKLDEMYHENHGHEHDESVHNGLMGDDTRILYNYFVKCRMPQTKQIIKKYKF